jgi:hypothetical protein
VAVVKGNIEIINVRELTKIVPMRIILGGKKVLDRTSAHNHQNSGSRRVEYILPSNLEAACVIFDYNLPFQFVACMAAMNLPKTERDWEASLSKYNVKGDRHKLSSASSASQIDIEEFLALRTLWLQKDLNALQKSHEDFGIKRSHADKATEVLENHTPGWLEYLRFIPKNNASKSGDPLPTETAGFASVLHNQREIFTILPSNKEEIKLIRSPYKLRPRGPPETFAGQIDGGIARHDALQTPQRPAPQTPQRPAPQTPQRPAPQTPQQPVPQAPPISPFDVESPFDKDIPTPAPAADEQIVNIALIGLLQGLTVHQHRRADWTIQRKNFRCGRKGSIAEFEARTDGALQNHSNNRCIAIIEVKARRRAGQFQIQMQESAQMAAWIDAEPESYWEVEGSPGVRQ